MHTSAIATNTCTQNIEAMSLIYKMYVNILGFTLGDESITHQMGIPHSIVKTRQMSEIGEYMMPEDIRIYHTRHT